MLYSLPGRFDKKDHNRTGNTKASSDKIGRQIGSGQVTHKAADKSAKDAACSPGHKNQAVIYPQILDAKKPCGYGREYGKTGPVTETCNNGPDK